LKRRKKKKGVSIIVWSFWDFINPKPDTREKKYILEKRERDEKKEIFLFNIV